MPSEWNRQEATRKGSFSTKWKRLSKIKGNPSEADLIEQVKKKQPQKQTYIKNLIRADMKKRGVS